MKSKNSVFQTPPIELVIIVAAILLGGFSIMIINNNSYLPDIEVNQINIDDQYYVGCVNDSYECAETNLIEEQQRAYALSGTDGKHLIPYRNYLVYLQCKSTYNNAAQCITNYLLTANVMINFDAIPYQTINNDCGNDDICVIERVLGG